MIIATHDGSFHADEAVACAVLTTVFEHAPIIRTRDETEMEKADLIIDVSGLNDERHFDHHSPDFTLARDNGVRYATAGLMWLHYGHEYMRKIRDNYRLNDTPDQVLERAFERIDREIMIAVDLNDNGQLNYYLDDLVHPEPGEGKRVFDELNIFYQNDPSIPYLVAMMNLPNISADGQNKAFFYTVKMLRAFIQNAAVNAIYTEMGIAKVLEAYDGGEILIMHDRLPWSSAVREHFELFDKCLLAVYPDRKRGWRVQALPLSRSERFKNKITAPKSWCGLNFEELDAVSGLKDAIFVHRSGFTGGTLTYEEALHMARLWIEKGDRHFA